MYKKIISYFLIFVFLFCNTSYAENLQLRVPIGDYLRLEETLRLEEAPQALAERRFKEVMGADFSGIRNFYIDERAGRYIFQKELKSKKDAWITYYYENSLPVELDGNIDDLLALHDEVSGEDENDIETRYLIFKRLARYRESASRIRPNLEWLLKREKSKRVLGEIQIALNMISGRTIDGGKRIKAAYVFYELDPFVRRGGVKDVAKELPRTFRNKRGNEASVFIPYWDGVIDEAVEKNNGGIRIEEVAGGSFELDGEKVQIYSIVMLNRLTGKFEPIDGVPIYLLKCDRYFSNIDKGDIYRQELDRGMPADSHLVHPENAMTALFFSKAVLEAMEAMKLKPDVISTADWQTAHVATLLKKSKNPEAYRFFENTKTLHTIHNIGPKGLVLASPYAASASDAKRMWDFMGITDDAYQPPDQNGVEFYGRASLQKGGIVYADKVSTVSISYASELKTEVFGSGFEGINAAFRVIGIPNGIALREWNSATSSSISHRFANSPSEKDRRLGVLDTREGKRENKKSMTAMINETRRQKTLLPDFRCDEDTPVFCFLGRFDDQKGLNILLTVLENEQKISGPLAGGKIKIVFAGTGNVHYMLKVKKLERAYPESVAYLGWADETAAKRLFAGADVDIMPSLFEPKGIVQMQAARFGVVNLVNKVGGLKDDITDFSEGENGNGYAVDFTKGEPVGLLRDAILRVIDDFDGKDKIGWDTKVRRVLADSEKFGWDLSCLKYELLFNSLIGNYSDLLIRHRVDHFDLASKPFGQVFQELDIDLSGIQALADLIKIGHEVGEAIVKNQGIGRPVDILLAGPPGALKTTLAKTLKEILSEYGISVEFVEIDSIGHEEHSFARLNKKYPGKNIIIAESVVYFPQDAEKADLFIRLTGSMPRRQARIEESSGSYEYAQIRTGVDVTDFKRKREDILMDTDFIKISHIESGSFKYFLEKGISIVLKSNILPQSSRNAGQSL